jgi:citrate lyase subunit beta/citryl-CoA lyase
MHMRSKLFVPGARPELFAKAVAGEADALSFDLEDSVPADGKLAARRAVAKFLGGAGASATAKRLIVRCNASETPEFAADIAALAAVPLHLINLPKVDSRDQVLAAIVQIQAAEAAAGTRVPPGLLLTIESPAGLRNAAAIASAHPRIVGLQLGLGDLFEPLGIDRRDAANLHAVLFALCIAAGEAGVYALDGAYPGIDDAAGFEAEAAMSRALGYRGKSCIHPRQVALANRIFTPTEAELDDARRLVAAAAGAQAAGHGAFRVDGRMVDGPFLRRARDLLASVQSQESRG